MNGDDTGVNRTGALLLDGSLRLFATPVQRNDLAVLSHSFDRGPAALIWRSPFGRNIFGVSNLGEFFLVSIQPPKLSSFVPLSICMDGVGRIVRHLANRQ
jgi:hypothetical protein